MIIALSITNTKALFYFIILPLLRSLLLIFSIMYDMYDTCIHFLSQTNINTCNNRMNYSNLWMPYHKNMLQQKHKSNYIHSQKYTNEIQAVNNIFLYMSITNSCKKISNIIYLTSYFQVASLSIFKYMHYTTMFHKDSDLNKIILVTSFFIKWEGKKRNKKLKYIYKYKNICYKIH